MFKETHLKVFANSQPSTSNFKSFSRSLEQCFLTVGQNNFRNKIPFLFSFYLQWRHHKVFSIEVPQIRLLSAAFFVYTISIASKAFFAKHSVGLWCHRIPEKLLTKNFLICTCNNSKIMPKIEISSMAFWGQKVLTDWLNWLSQFTSSSKSHREISISWIVF